MPEEHHFNKISSMLPCRRKQNDDMGLQRFGGEQSSQLMRCAVTIVPPAPNVLLELVILLQYYITIFLYITILLSYNAKMLLYCYITLLSYY